MSAAAPSAPPAPGDPIAPPAPNDALAPAGDLELDERQREAVLEEIAALAASLQDPAARERWAELGRAIAEGAGPLAAEQAARLESVLALSLETGRARRVQGPEAEQALLRLYRKTPGGAAVEQLTRAANQALAALAGQRLSSIAFTPGAPGTFKLEIATDACSLVVEVGRRGVTVDSVGVDL